MADLGLLTTCFKMMKLTLELAVNVQKDKD